MRSQGGRRQASPFWEVRALREDQPSAEPQLLLWILFSPFRNTSEFVAALQSYGEESRRAASAGEDCQAKYSSAINPVPVLQLTRAKVARKDNIFSSCSMNYLSLSLLPPPQETPFNLSELV